MFVTVCWASRSTCLIMRFCCRSIIDECFVDLNATVLFRVGGRRVYLSVCLFYAPLVLSVFHVDVNLVERR